MDRENGGLNLIFIPPMQLLLVKNRVSPDKRLLFIGNPYEWRGRRGEEGNYRCSSLSTPIPPLLRYFTKKTKLPPSLSLFLRLVAKQLVPIRSGNWVDIGNESEEQITGVGEGGRRGASSQRGITAFVPRMAREHFPEETRNTISRWILEPTPLFHPRLRTRRGPSIRLIYIVDVRFLLSCTREEGGGIAGGEEGGGSKYRRGR